MAYYKRFLIIFLILLLLLFNFNSVFAIEENNEVESVDISVISGLDISSNSNHFYSNSSTNIGYFPIESGYIYYITNNNSVNSIDFCVSTSTPNLNVNYNYMGVITAKQTYSYIGDGEYFYFACNTSSTGTNVSVSRQKYNSQENTINALVDNVGPNALWGVFGSGIDFVFVVVIVAFGIFIIFKLIKGLSKGKSKI